MSVKLINKTIEDLGIKGLEIFYDFSSYSGGNFINSIESANALYSGEVIGDASTFTGTASGSGYFNEHYISIENTTGITDDSYTIIFSQEKTGVSPGVIYSDLDPMGPSGSEIGITASNKLYFKNYINGTPSYATLDSIPSDKNIYAVSINKFGYGTLSRASFSEKIATPEIYKFSNNTEEREEFFAMEEKRFKVLPYTISNGTNWRIGSGEFNYKGYMDYFLYFNKALGNDVLRRMAKSIYSDYSVTPAVTGITRGDVTGYSSTIESVSSGLTGTTTYSGGSSTESGYYTYISGEALTGCVGISGTVYRPYKTIGGVVGGSLGERILYKPLQNLAYNFGLSGVPTTSPLAKWQSTGNYWHFSGNSGTYKGVSATGAAGTLFGITGFLNHELTGYVTGQTSIQYEQSGISGQTSVRRSFSPLFGMGTIYTGTGEIINKGADVDEEYFPRALSVIDKTDPNYFYEVVFDISGEDSLNQIASQGFYGKFYKNIGRANSRIRNDNTNFAINGVSYFTGSPTYSKNQYNKPAINISTGFLASGTRIFTEVELSSTDKMIYDTVPSGEKNIVEITGLSQYSASPFASIGLEGNQIFFNGVKLYSGINYIDNGGFYPSGAITGATGIYFTYRAYSGANYATGSGLRPLSVDHSAITPNGSVLFANGIRQPTESIIEHARYSDLITGTRIVRNVNKIYQMNNGVQFNGL